MGGACKVSFGAHGAFTATTAIWAVPRITPGLDTWLISSLKAHEALLPMKVPEFVMDQVSVDHRLSQVPSGEPLQGVELLEVARA